MIKHPAIFFDRDGTIIEDRGYIKHTLDIAFYPYSFKALQNIQKYFLLFIITNQSGISKGIITKNEVEEVNKCIQETLKRNGIAIYDTFYCPHKNEDDCHCKKPKPFFINHAAKIYTIDLSKSFMIGDHPSDVECGINAGITPVYLLSGHVKMHQNEIKKGAYVCENILEASKYILSTLKI